MRGLAPMGSDRGCDNELIPILGACPAVEGFLRGGGARPSCKIDYEHLDTRHPILAHVSTQLVRCNQGNLTEQEVRRWQ